ncbi:uncharacterized protein METZ01_LOCUS259545 [marine metagenome]|uniref:Uncharacterized protein n=1 Tax=marine metagenome TaxID=408172 RepID=A0A382J788_9ZZZZ
MRCIPEDSFQMSGLTVKLGPFYMDRIEATPIFCW